jgi:hypothetical protein
LGEWQQDCCEGFESVASAYGDEKGEYTVATPEECVGGLEGGSSKAAMLVGWAWVGGQVGKSPRGNEDC